MPHFQIHVEWASSKVRFIEAEDMDEAIELAGDTEVGSYYIEDSWLIRHEFCEEVSKPPAQAPIGDIFTKYIGEMKELELQIRREEGFDEVDGLCDTHLAIALTNLEAAYHQMKLASLSNSGAK